MNKENNWFEFKRVGFSEKELIEMKKNPIKVRCGTCDKVITGCQRKEDANCDNVECIIGMYDY